MEKSIPTELSSDLHTCTGTLEPRHTCTHNNSNKFGGFLCTCMCIGMCMCLWVPEGSIRFPRAGVNGSCDLPGLGDGKRTQVLWKGICAPDFWVIFQPNKLLKEEFWLYVLVMMWFGLIWWSRNLLCSLRRSETLNLPTSASYVHIFKCVFMLNMKLNFNLKKKLIRVCLACMKRWLWTPTQ